MLGGAARAQRRCTRQGGMRQARARRRLSRAVPCPAAPEGYSLGERVVGVLDALQHDVEAAAHPQALILRLPAQRGEHRGTGGWARESEAASTGCQWRRPKAASKAGAAGRKLKEALSLPEGELVGDHHVQNHAAAPHVRLHACAGRRQQHVGGSSTFAGRWRQALAWACGGSGIAACMQPGTGAQSHSPCVHRTPAPEGWSAPRAPGTPACPRGCGEADKRGDTTASKFGGQSSRARETSLPPRPQHGPSSVAAARHAARRGARHAARHAARQAA